MAESLTAHRLANPIEGDQAPATQVARTLYGCLCNDEKNLINVCPYKPEDLNNEEIKNLLLKSCSEGNFIPFMVNFYRDDVEPEDANNLLIVVAGVGENPDENFIVMTIWLQKVQDEMGMVFSNENGEEQGNLLCAGCAGYACSDVRPARVYRKGGSYRCR
jgi:hypothetical protein